MRKQFVLATALVSIFYVWAAFYMPLALYSMVITVPLITIGFKDFFQKKQSILRNFPVLGHFRYLMEAIRPEIHQYFVETNSEGKPFSRENRSLIYQRAKKVTDTLPFGTQKNLYEIGYEWVNHSIAPQICEESEMTVKVGSSQCKKPYIASRFNISAMSYGALSKNAILALSEGAKLGKFYHNTGEGGLSPYHLKGGGDLVWQIGTGYFGCRDASGNFDPKKFEERAVNEQVKMIEIKLSQGAKPGHGGLLPASKVTKEISEIRGVEMGHDVHSPAYHKAFSTPVELLKFVKTLRDLSGGKPVGFKLCVGKRHEFVAICKAIIKTKIYPDFITVDGGEGGTGAAPLEFSNYVGTPLREGLILVHNCLIGFGLRDQIRVIASGKVTTGFEIVSKLCIGADICNSARGMMLALGCIQALQCNTNKCPAGVATQDPNLVAGLDIPSKSIRVFNFQKETLKSAADMIGAMGLKNPKELKPYYLIRRFSETEVQNYTQMYEYLNEGELLKKTYPDSYKFAMTRSSPDSFDAIEIDSKEYKKTA